MGRVDAVTKFVKRYDPKLFCESRDGKLCVCREGQRIESYDVNGVRITFIRPAPYVCFALTEDWTVATEGVDRGLEQIRDRLVTIDLWSGRDIAAELIKAEEDRAASRDRAVDNHIESYLKDVRRDFARSTNDILTHSLKKD